MTELLVSTPRWLLLAALIYAPWAYGGTRPWTVDVLNLVLGAIIILWLMGCAVRRVWPVIPRVPLVVAGCLLAQAWWMVLNAKSEYDTTAFQYVPLSPWLSWAPGSLHRSLSLSTAIRASALLAVGCFCCDLARRPLWRRRLLFTMALTGLSLVVFGMLERLTGAPRIFWGPVDQGESFFATYRYHANAGAFINIVWPVTAGLLLVAFRKEDDLRKRVFWSAALILCLAGVFVNASRAANLIALALVGLWLGWIFWKRRRGSNRPPVKPAMLVVACMAVVILLAFVAAFGGLDTSLRRWGKFDQEWSARNPRLLVAEVCMRMLPDAGCCGFGPGVFQTVFPYYTTDLGDEISGVWLYAHDDYLQTLVEWGWLGGCLWAVYVLGGLIFSWVIAGSYRAQLSATDRLTLFAVWAAFIGVMIHAGMDFPLQVASIQLYVVVLLGLLWSCRSWIGTTASRSRLSRSASEESGSVRLRKRWNEIEAPA